MKTDGSDARAVTLPTATADGADGTDDGSLGGAASPFDVTRAGQPSTGGPTATSQPLIAPHPDDHDRYRLLGEHGRGGLGRVSRAHDRKLGRDIAIKELLARGAVSERRFIREALVTARLEHPGIVPVYEAGRWSDGTPFYAMKLVSGQPLRALLAASKTVEQRIGLLHHVIAVADAIAYAHGRNIIHRDLKPANIIVGEFGETVVIDWGLAKDLTASEEPVSISAETISPAEPTSRDDGLTTAGSVLGTPAYMSPEQERGESVDQRADVYAIGAMLWELCSLRPLAPSEAGQRRSILRRAGTDEDLAAIVDKALAPDPAQRYADAAALAADLKAFKAGARIAARRYSPWARLVHWTRRHRALTTSAAVIAMLAVAGAVVYVRNIAVERDRADAALARTQAAKDELTLEHAELLLRSDPTAAVAALTDYRGNDELRRQRLIAEASGLGVASKRLEPHSDSVLFLAGSPDGTIVSLGEDGRIQRTLNGSSTPLASDVSPDVTVAYAPSTGILAYETSPAGVALLRLADQATARIDAVNVEALSFAPDGSRLAALTEQGELIVWSIASLVAREIYRAPLPGASHVAFATLARLVVQGAATTRVIAIDPAGGSAASAAIAGAAVLDASADAVVVGTRDGEIQLLSPTLQATGTASPCHARVTTVRLVPGTDQLAFACRDGHAGLLRFDSSHSHLEAVETFPIRGSAYATVDPSGHYVTLCDESRTAYLYDLETRLLQRYDGHAGLPTFIAPPTPAFHHVLTGDSNGTVRQWDLPPGQASVVFQAPEPLLSLIFGPDGKTLLVSGNEPVAYTIDLPTRATFELRGDTPMFSGQIAPDDSSMVTYGQSGAIRVWRARDHALLRTFREHKGAVGEVDYVDSQHLVSVGDDGRLLQWSPSGSDVLVLFTSPLPLGRLEVSPGNHHIVVHDSRGGVWDIAPDHAVKSVRTADGATITLLRMSSDGKLLAVGTDAGLVEVYAASDWRIVHTLHLDGRIAQLRFDPRGRDLVIGVEARHSQLGRIYVLRLTTERSYRWLDVPAAVRDIAYAPDGEILGFVCSDGGTWLYSMTSGTWVYANEGRTDVSAAAFSADGRLLASIDRHGSVVVRDVAAIFRASGK